MESVPHRKTAGFRPTYGFKYDPNQPRTPAGQDGAGRWAAESGGDPISLAANVIRVCILSGVARITDIFGNRSYSATYQCTGNQEFSRSGFGEAPGLVLDPFATF
jgi:hypothetical protein